MAHGGKRQGAGRRAGAVNKVTAKHKATLTELAQAYTQEALDTLAKVMRDPKAPHNAQVAASNSLLDRGHGKPQQAIEHKGDAFANLADRLGAALSRVNDG